MGQRKLIHALFAFGFLPFAVSGCAILFKVQLSDIESRGKGEPISIIVSETAIDFQQAGKILESVGRAAKHKKMQDAGGSFDAITSMFQFGPRTGVPVFSDIYASQVGVQLVEKCKGGHLANIISIREARSYPVVSGQIVRIDATCYRKKG